MMLVIDRFRTIRRLSMEHPRKVNLHIDDASLLCKAGCGFYGNPAWQDYCSVCFKKYRNQAKLGTSSVEVEINLVCNYSI